MSHPSLIQPLYVENLGQSDAFSNNHHDLSRKGKIEDQR